MSARTLSLFAGLSLAACNGGADGPGASTPRDDCGHGELDQVLAGASAPELPTGQEGPLAEALVGVWQHTWTDDGEGTEPFAISDDSTDIRFAITSDDRFLYCQQVDILGEDADVNETELVLDGDLIDISAAGYTALLWSADVMVWRNNLFEDRTERFILERIE